MKAIIVGTAVFCVALIGIAVYFVTRPAVSLPRVLALNQQYIDRQQQGGWVKGPATPQVKVTEFGDFQCPACGAFEPELSQALAQTSDYVQFTFQDYPLSQHNKARVAAEAAEAAGRQGKFWEMHDMLYASQQDWENDTIGAFKDRAVTFAQNMGLNTEQFKNDQNDPNIDEEINKDVAKGDALPVLGTPTLVINGKAVASLPTSVDALVALFNSSRVTATLHP